MNEIDKALLYGRFDQNEAKKERLALRAAHKALDIAEDEMEINANKITHGIGAMGAVGIALASSILPAALAGFLLLREPGAAKTPALEPQKFRVDWRVNDGKSESKVTPIQ